VIRRIIMKKRTLWILGFLAFLSVTYIIAMAADITDLEGITGKVGKEDIEWGQGTSDDTYSITSYDGGTATLTRVPSLYEDEASVIKNAWFVNAASTITDHGAASGADYEAYNAKAVMDLSGASNMVYPGNTVYNFTTGVTVPTNITSVFFSGVSITPAAGVSIWITGPIIAGNYPIFDCSASGSTVILTDDALNGIVCEAWWGTGHNIGIGKVPDGYKLDVQGGIRGTSLSGIENSNLPDPITSGVSTSQPITGGVSIYNLTSSQTLTAEMLHGSFIGNYGATSGITLTVVTGFQTASCNISLDQDQTSGGSIWVVFQTADKFINKPDFLCGTGAGSSVYFLSGTTGESISLVGKAANTWRVWEEGTPSTNTM